MKPEEMLARHEGKTLEFKREASSPLPILKTLSAFSNTAGGILVIGVEDRTRRVVGVEAPLDLEERIMSLATDGIRPQILPEVEVVSVRKKALLCVTVHPGPLRPYWVERLGAEKGAFVRVGSTNRPASPELLAELDRTARNVAFDEQPLAHLDIDELDLPLIKERLSSRRDFSRRDLRTLRLTHREGGRDVPTVGGVILFGRERLQHFPDARIRLARFAGTDRASIIDRTDVDADPVQAIDDALAFIRRNTAVGMSVEGARRRDVPQYPPIALREAVVNAVVHADYSQAGSPIRVAIFDDRIVVENPGLLPFGLTLEDIRSGISKLRNRVIGRVFHELGLIEQWGSGIERMVRACNGRGLETPSFEEIGTHFRLTMFAKSRTTRKSASGTGGRIFELLADDTARSTSVIAEALELTKRTIRTHLQRLVEQGLVVEVGEGPNDPRRVYRRVRE